MLEPDGSPNTAHSLNPVPLIVTAPTGCRGSRGRASSPTSPRRRSRCSASSSRRDDGALAARVGSRPWASAPATRRGRSAGSTSGCPTSTRARPSTARCWAGPRPTCRPRAASTRSAPWRSGPWPRCTPRPSRRSACRCGTTTSRCRRRRRGGPRRGARRDRGGRAGGRRGRRPDGGAGRSRGRPAVAVGGARDGGGGARQRPRRARVERAGTRDPDAAQRFYGELFGWTFEGEGELDTGTEYLTIRNGEPLNGGIRRITAMEGDTPAHWLPTFGVSSTRRRSRAADRAFAAGASVIAGRRWPDGPALRRGSGTAGGGVRPRLRAGDARPVDVFARPGRG